MKISIFFLLSIAILLCFSCKKEDPEIAGIDELSAIALSESFMVQPISYENNIVSIINKNEEAILCSYDANGNKLWQQGLENYTLRGTTVHDVDYLNLQKDANNQIVINMYRVEENAASNAKNQYIKAIKFSESGQFIWQMQDSIHQPDTIIIGVDTIDVRANADFEAGGFLSFSDGTYAAISSQIARATGIDSTYIQLTSYNNSGQLIGDKYLKLPSRWNVVNAYVTSNDNIFIFSGNNLGDRTLKLINLQGELLFEKNPSQNLFEIYFFYESSQGNYIISAAYFENSDVANGVTICVDKSGNILWNLPSKTGQQGGFMRSVQEQSDGYLFSGFSSSSALFDWRNETTNNDYKAIIQKADLSGNRQWDTTFINNFNSAGAGTIGSSDFSFFIGKKDGPIKNILLLKLDSEGKINN